MTIAKTFYAKLSQFVGSDIPKWVGGVGVKTTALIADDVSSDALLGTYNGDMQKIEYMFTAHKSLLDSITSNGTIFSFLAKATGGKTVAGSDLMDKTITHTQIQDKTLLTGNYADESVTTDILGDLSVTNEKVALKAIQGKNIEDHTITEQQIDPTLMSDLQTAGTTPTGTITMFAGDSTKIPLGWLNCVGQPVSRSGYAGLFEVIGTIYGVGDGSTTFGIPNLKGRVPVGFLDGDTSFGALNRQGGEKAHILADVELASHAHVIPVHTHIAESHNHEMSHRHTIPHAATTIEHGKSGGDTELARGTAGNTGASDREYTEGEIVTIQNSPADTSVAAIGSNLAHNNLQPYIVLNYIIKT